MMMCNLGLPNLGIALKFRLSVGIFSWHREKRHYKLHCDAEISLNIISRLSILEFHCLVHVNFGSNQSSAICCGYFLEWVYLPVCPYSWQVDVCPLHAEVCFSQVFYSVDNPVPNLKLTDQPPSMSFVIMVSRPLYSRAISGVNCLTVTSFPKKLSTKASVFSSITSFGSRRNSPRCPSDFCDIGTQVV